MPRYGIVILALCSLLSWLGVAHAGPAEERLARAKFDEGLALSDAGRWAEALEAFRESDRIKPAVSVRFNIAATLRALGRYVEARDTAQKILDDADKLQPKPKLRAQAQALIDEVSAKIGRVSLSVVPRKARVEVDGTPVEQTGKPVEVDPGRHVFVVRAPGHETTTVTQDVPSGASQLALTAPQLPPPTPAAKPTPAVEEEEPLHQKWWLWTTVAGIAVAGAVVAVVVVVTLPEDPAAPAPPSTTVPTPFPVVLRF
jgi:hypothetical protein